MYDSPRSHLQTAFFSCLPLPSCVQNSDAHRPSRNFHPGGVIKTLHYFEGIRRIVTPLQGMKIPWHRMSLHQQLSLDVTGGGNATSTLPSPSPPRGLCVCSVSTRERKVFFDTMAGRRRQIHGDDLPGGRGSGEGEDGMGWGTDVESSGRTKQ